jgi:malate synthase
MTSRVDVIAPALSSDHPFILNKEAMQLVGELTSVFGGRREQLLLARKERQRRFDAGDKPNFLESTKDIRLSDWTVAPLLEDLHQRKVEITGPVERKMIINALNSGADVFMADFEDSNAPTWSNVLDGQVNLCDAVRRTIKFQGEGKSYQLNEKTATLMVRPRGWHLLEKHVEHDGKPVPASLFDFGLYFFHNARALLERGTAPYFYLPKMESHLEARLWNDVFNLSEDRLGLARGTIKATCLIETLPAAFEMDEILWELREHSAGLNCGRWDYIFSSIKTLKNDPDFVLPDRGQVGMTQPFLRAYTQLLIKTCHRRGAHAMGGMAAQIPIKNDQAANDAAMEKVRQDKLREVTDGHDGTWVAHPALVAIAREIFEANMSSKNQIATKKREDVNVTREDLLRVPEGTRTEKGLRMNIDVGVSYLAAWLRGLGCVPLHHLMEDAATAEISRTQVWQWIKHGARLDDGRAITKELFQQIMESELSKGDQNADYAEAARMFAQLSTASTCEDFLTLPAYERLLERENSLSPR